jgi:hypothetical protein
MKHAVLASALLLSMSMPALAADEKAAVKTNFIDHSNHALIEEATAFAVMGENIPAKVWKIHPRTKYAFLSQVEGGVNASGLCVVTARVMVLPLTATVRAPLFRPLPKLTATAYDAIPGSTLDKCKLLAKDKLKEATTAVVSTIVKT